MKFLIIILTITFSISSLAQGLTHLEYNALTSYIGDDYKNINKYLRMNNRVNNPLMEAQIKLTSEALAKLPLYKEITYRGVCLLNKDIADSYLKKENIVSDPAFMSSSKDIYVAYDFLEGEKDCIPILMIIDGHTGADLSEFAKYYFGHDSIQYEEEEVLFNHGKKFLVEKVKIENQGKYKNIKIVYLKEIDIN